MGGSASNVSEAASNLEQATGAILNGATAAMDSLHLPSTDSAVGYAKDGNHYRIMGEYAFMSLLGVAGLLYFAVVLSRSRCALVLAVIVGLVGILAAGAAAGGEFSVAIVAADACYAPTEFIVAQLVRGLRRRRRRGRQSADAGSQTPTFVSLFFLVSTVCRTRRSSARWPRTTFTATQRPPCPLPPPLPRSVAVSARDHDKSDSTPVNQARHRSTPLPPPPTFP